MGFQVHCGTVLGDAFSTWRQICPPKQSHNALSQPSRPGLSRNLNVANLIARILNFYYMKHQQSLTLEQQRLSRSHSQPLFRVIIFFLFILFRWNACWWTRGDAFLFRHARRPCCSCPLKEAFYSEEVLLKFKSLAPKISRAPRM